MHKNAIFNAIFSHSALFEKMVVFWVRKQAKHKHGGRASYHPINIPHTTIYRIPSRETA